MTPHINAPAGAFADAVLMPGDPLRAKYIAETFLEKRARSDQRSQYVGLYRHL